MASSISLETLSHLQGAQLFVGSAIAYVFGVRRMQVKSHRGVYLSVDVIYRISIDTQI